MKSDIKKKFIDILFEPEEEDEVIFEKPKAEPRPLKKQESTVKAKDILYRKPEKSSAFINLDETKKKEPEKKETEKVYGDYEFSSQISPIFGVIKENKPKFNTTAPVNENLINRPDSSHLEIITSPIYGYGNRDDFEKDSRNAFAQPERSEEDELHSLFENDYGYDEHTYDDIDDDQEINLFSSYGEDD